MHHLVTGGAGFIGSALVQRRLADGHRVTIVDIAPEQYRGDVSHPRLHIVNQDVRDIDGLRPLAWEADQIVHLASKVGVAHYIDEPFDTVTTTINGAESVLRLADEFDIPVIMASTSEAYGKVASLPMRETDDILFGPTNITRWVYGMAKALAESLALAAHRDNGIDVRIFRPFNVVGPEQDPTSGLVFARFAHQVANGQPLTVHGDGTQTRTFCHVDDLVDGIVRIMQAPETSGQVINLGSDEELSIGEIADMFVNIAQELLGRPVTVVTAPHRETYPHGFEDAYRRAPDLTLARDLIGWDAEHLTPVETIIEQTIADAVQATNDLMVTGRPHGER